jgi:general stress protein 26
MIDTYDVREIFDGALVSVLSYDDGAGGVSSHPMLPLYNPENKKLYFTSSILFSRKIQKIKKCPRVSVIFTGRDFIKSPRYHVVLVKGDARVYEEDLHNGWEWLLRLWRKKEPYIDSFLKQRISLPLFWERAVIEVTPVEILVWAGGDTSGEPVRVVL